MSGIGLRDRVLALLQDAAVVYAGTPWEARFVAAAREVDGPLRVALAGRVKAGKSTLLNALVGEAVAATDAGECTRIVTEYAHGVQDAAFAVIPSPQPPAGHRDGRGSRAGAGQGSRADAGQGSGQGAGLSSRWGPPSSPAPVPLRLSRQDGRATVDLSGVPATGVSRLLVTVPNERLHGLTVIDTPGLASLSHELGAGAQRFLISGTPEAAAPDAVLYLLRQLHATDTDFLQAFRDPAARRIPPVNAIGVLSRTDEIGGGRGDALQIAARLAADYAQEPRLRPFVQTVVPVAGLLAEASVLLRDEDVADLRALADLAPSVTDTLLLSADRFCAARRFVPVGVARRGVLLERLGLFGLRWSLDAIRTGRAADPARLRAGLAEVSGIDELRRVLNAQITGRRDVLKADAALRLVRAAVAAGERPGGRRLAAVAERLSVGAHDFRELHLLNALRLGGVEVDDQLRQRMEELLGACGGDLRTRLGLPDGAGSQEVRERLTAEHRRWQYLAADPLTPPTLRRACDVLLRSLQGFHRDLAHR